MEVHERGLLKIVTESSVAEVPTQHSACHPDDSNPQSWNEPGAAASYPDASPTLITEFKERWLGDDDDFDLRWPQGSALVILATGITRTYHVLTLQGLTGLPAVFLESVTASLRRCGVWLAPEGYCKLVADIASGMGDDDIDRTVGHLLLEILDVSELTACDEAWQLGMRRAV